MLGGFWRFQDCERFYFRFIKVVQYERKRKKTKRKDSWSIFKLVELNHLLSIRTPSGIYRVPQF